MTSALAKATTLRTFESIWSAEKARLMKSCFGIDRVSGVKFERRRRYEFFKIQERLVRGLRPHGLLAIAKPKVGGGNRIICVPTIADRLIQFSLCDALRADLRSMGLDNPVSFGLVRGPGKGAPDARRLACKMRAAHPWVYKADIVKFFDQLSRDVLEEAVRSCVRKRSLHDILIRFIHTEIEDGFDRDWRKIVYRAGIRSGVGIRQGMPLSPYFAGMYLRRVDQALQQRSFPAIRYVDDIVAFFDSETECLAFHNQLRTALQQLGLEIGELSSSSSKTCVFSPSDSAPFLGMEISPRSAGDYCLTISEPCIDKVICRFDELNSVSARVHKGVMLTEAGSYLQSIKNGYLNAYNGAQNRDDLRDRMDQAAGKALTSVLCEIFGDRLKDMPSQHREFVGLPA